MRINLSIDTTGQGERAERDAQALRALADVLSPPDCEVTVYTSKANEKLAKQNCSQAKNVGDVNVDTEKSFKETKAADKPKEEKPKKAKKQQPKPTTNVDEALKTLDDAPAAEKPKTDDPVKELKRMAIQIVKKRGPKGTKEVSAALKEATGQADVSKVTAEQFGAVQARFQAILDQPVEEKADAGLDY